MSQPHRSGTRPLTGRLSPGPAQALAELQVEIGHGEQLVAKLAPRMRVLDDAFGILLDPTRAFAVGLRTAPPEGSYVIRVLELLTSQPGVGQRVQIVLHQYRTAKDTVARYAEAAKRASGLQAEPLLAFLAGYPAEKLRSALFPLVNVQTLFRDAPLIAALLPPPPEGASPSRSGTRPLGSGGLLSGLLRHGGDGRTI